MNFINSIIPAAQAHTGDDYFGHHMMTGDWSAGGYIFMFIFWIAIIVGVVLFIKWLLEQNQRKDKTALDILQERYAEGEIDKKEYEEKKKDLRG